MVERFKGFVEGMRPWGPVIAMYVEETANLTGSFLLLLIPGECGNERRVFSNITIICKPSQHDPLKVQRYYICRQSCFLYIAYLAPGLPTNYIIYTSELLTRLVHFLIFFSFSYIPFYK